MRATFHATIYVTKARVFRSNWPVLLFSKCRNLLCYLITLSVDRQNSDMWLSSCYQNTGAKHKNDSEALV